MKEPKSNNCKMVFICQDINNCVYVTDKEDCKYNKAGVCTSLISIANVMTVTLKALTK